MNIDEIISRALEAGFTYSVPLDVSTLRLRPEVRDTCATNKCGVYGCTWSCPPACGTLEECGERIKNYHRGIIVQTMGELEDEFDIEGIHDISTRHGENFYRFTAELRKEYPKLLALGAGTCKVCEKCAWPEPCRAPELAVSSMEAYGLGVSDVCTANNIQYYYGRNTLCFVGCYLID